MVAAMASDTFTRQLFLALARNTPAFQPPPGAAGRPVGLLAALARSTPAFASASSQMPTGPQESIAEPFGEVTVDAQDLDSVSSTFPDDENVVVLPRLQLIRERAAATTPRPPIAMEGLSEQLGARYVLREAAPGELELLIEAATLPTADVVFHIAVSSEGRRQDYLLLPTADPSGLHVADLLIPVAGDSIEVSVATRSASALGAGDVATIRRSVRRTGRPGRNAWRAIARGRPPEDAVRTAILLEL
jgi:hypothetical protein